MKKLKDLMYNISDVLVAILILAIAALLILWRMDKALTYPSTILRENVETNVEIDTSFLPEDDTNYWDGDILLKKIVIDVPEGATSEEISGILVAEKVFSNIDEFERTISNMGKTVRQIDSGSFEFKKGTTKEEIINMIIID